MTVLTASSRRAHYVGADTQLGGLGLESLLWAQLVSVADLWVLLMLFIGDELHRRRHGQV